MGMGIEPFSIHEWEWELIPIFWQRMGMGINSSFLVNGPKSGFAKCNLKYLQSIFVIYTKVGK